ncbi:MAG: hypothetical protein AB7N76_01450 [Planctomycetota bacterium]
MNETEPSPPDPQGPPSELIVPGKRVLPVLGVAFLVLFGAMIAARIYLPRWVEANRQRLELQCADQLRRVGAAARAYAAEHGGRLPHLGAPGQLDGGPETSDGPRALRALVVGRYLQDPKDLLCPAAPHGRGARAHGVEQSAWLKGQGQGDAPTLEACAVISYGWTRRALTLNDPGRWPLAADRAAMPRRGPEGMLGNHTRGWNVLSLGGEVRFAPWDEDPFPGSWLTATEQPDRDGFLGLRIQQDRSVFDPRPE